MPETLRRLNFIFFDDPERFDANADKLAEALQTNIGWIKTAHILDAGTGEKLKILNGHDDPVHFAAFSPDSRRIVTASADKTARLPSRPT